MLAFCIYEHSEVFCLRRCGVFVSALTLFEYDIHKVHVVALYDSVKSTVSIKFSSGMRQHFLVICLK